ncbi:hypothetical protein SDC9_142513 [bioreactor metagenome]|uniref:Uncharacterized protein n=1 Tax=bioreactor metagenome TaxID=1076179 RepID=A0A645E1D4_9ZZZZ
MVVPEDGIEQIHQPFLPLFGERSLKILSCRSQAQRLIHEVLVPGGIDLRQLGSPVLFQEPAHLFGEAASRLVGQHCANLHQRQRLRFLPSRLLFHFHACHQDSQ